MHIITFPDKRTLAGFVEAEGLDEGQIFWRGATDMLSEAPPRATEPQFVQYIKELAAKNGGKLQEVPKLAAAPEAKEDIQPRAQLIIHDHGVMDCIDPSLLFSLNRTGKINVSEVRVRDLLPPDGPPPPCLANRSPEEVVAEKQEGTTYTLTFQTPLTIPEDGLVQIEGQPDKHVIDDVEEYTSGNQTQYLVTASFISDEPIGYRFFHPDIRDWFNEQGPRQV